MSRRTAQEELTRTGPQKGGSTGSVERVVRDGVLIFHSIHRVMRAEKILKSCGVDVRLVPVPRQLSSDCGLALVFPLSQRNAVQEELEAAGCLFEEVHASRDDGYHRLA
jgi:hypothetical protein